MKPGLLGYISLVWLLYLPLAGCSSTDDDGQPGLSVHERPAEDRTLALEQLYQETQSHPLAYYYMNRAHAAHIQAEAAALGGPMPPALRQGYASSLLKAGLTEAAIEQYLLLQKDADYASPYSTTGKPLLESLGIAYLRLGEQQNCILNHSAASCILPLQPDAIHTLPTGSRKAIEIYTTLLGRYRTDLQSRWLLNVAHMTLGTYPEGVPPHLLIPGLQAPSPSSFPPFENIADRVGFSAEELSGGVAVDDFNGDGLLDIFTTAHRLNDRARLFLSDSTGGFQEHSDAAGLSMISGGLNVAPADYNNDGFPDVLILRGGWLGEAGQHPNSLLKNNGDGTFEDVTEEARLLDLHPTQTAAWADFNKDGWLDLFVGNEESDQWLRAWQTASTSPSMVDRSHPSTLYQNNGDGTFTDVTQRVGLNVTAFVKGVAWGDVNNDGLPDLYLSIIGSPNRLYMNRGSHPESTWHFEEIEAGVHEPFFSFPTWFFDFDNDGWEDLFVGSYDLRRINEVAGDVAREALGIPVETEMPRLYRNNGDESFTDVTEEMGLLKVLFAMGSNFGDLDNDGFLDFYVGTGAPDLSSLVPNRMFHNQRGQRFEEVTYAGRFGHLQKGHAVAFADFDQDGDQDIYASIGGAYEGDGFRNVLFENPGSTANNAWVSLQLEGRSSNRSAIGARIEIVVSGPGNESIRFFRTVSTGGSFGASSPLQEIGLGQTTRIDELRITWPNQDQTIEVYTNLEVNRYYHLVEGAGEALPVHKNVLPFRSHMGSSSPHAPPSHHGRN